jgi:catechol 2,3-dioxygenase
VIGLKVSDESATTIHLRGVEERAHHSLTLKKTKEEEAACERVGFRVFAEDDLDKAKAHFDRHGVAAKFVNVPFQGRTLHASDAAGTPLEFCARMKTLPRVHTRTHEHKGAGALRLDHHQVLVPDVATAAGFYATLGFRVSDCMDVDERIVAIFLHRKDNPHDLVLLARSGPRFHHSGYIVSEMHHVVRALDAAGNLGFAANIEHGPGRHGFGHSYYVYLRDPDGHRIELLLPAVQIIDIDEEPVRHDVSAGANLWGPPPPRSWFEEASPLAGATVTQVPDGDPLTLEKYLFARAGEPIKKRA